MAPKRYYLVAFRSKGAWEAVKKGAFYWGDQPSGGDGPASPSAQAALERGLESMYRPAVLTQAQIRAIEHAVGNSMGLGVSEPEGLDLMVSTSAVRAFWTGWERLTALWHPGKGGGT
jgi:hypothetical protein